MDLDAIDALCRYFDVPVNELLEYVEDVPAKAA
ncbi:MAG: helix-turn-helix domain-containing protein [Hydrogenophaga sp.]|nr:helix-turn-helix domain-containing protein [Hydrogenophaga sp.]